MELDAHEPRMVPALDDLGQGTVGRQAGDGEPRFLPSMACDKTTGLYAVQAVMAALLHRERSGEGQQVEVPMFETNVHFNLMEHLAGMHYAPPVGEAGYVRAKYANRRPHRTRDGYLCILAASTKHWRAFFEAVGRPELADDERIKDPATRYKSTDALYALIGEIAAQWDTEPLKAALEAADIPCAPVYDFEEIPDDPHLRAIGFFRDEVHPTEGPVIVPEPPVRFSGSPGGERRPAPRLGEHSIEVLREVGFADAEIEAMLAAGTTVDGRLRA